MKSDWWKRLILIWDNASYHVSLMVRNYINAQKEEDWLTIIHLPKKAPYLNPNERKVNQLIKSHVCANRFYEHIEEQKTAVSEFLDNRFEDGIMTFNMTLDLPISLPWTTAYLSSINPCQFEAV